METVALYRTQDADLNVNQFVWLETFNGLCHRILTKGILK